MSNYNAVAYSLLSTESTITDELANDPKGGKAIYPIRIPQKVSYPAVTFRKSIDPIHLKAGDAQRTFKVEFEIDVIAEDPDKCDEIQQLIYDRLDGRTHEDVAGHYVNNLKFQGQDPEIYSDDPDLFLITSRYTCTIHKL
jgi:hypothetical protein